MAVFIYLNTSLLVGTTEMGRAGHFDFGLDNDRDGKSAGIAGGNKVFQDHRVEDHEALSLGEWSYQPMGRPRGPRGQGIVGLVDIGLVGEDEQVLTAHPKLSDHVDRILQLQGLVQLDDELASAGV